MTQPEPQQVALAPAVIEETFTPQTLNVIGHEPQPGAPGRVAIRFLVGQAGPDVFLAAKVAQLDPQLAVTLGEHLIREGNRLKSGLILAGPQAPHTI